jgi:hypothetical protein
VNPRTLALLLVLALAVRARVASAEAVPLSAIPLASPALPRVEQKVARIDGVRKVGDTFVSALDQPVCVGTFDPSTEDFVAKGAVRYWDSDPSPQELEVLRLETDGEPSLERTVIDRETPLDHATVLRHARIALALIVGGPVPVYAYRTKTKLHVFVRQGFDLAVDAFDPRMGDRQGCGFDSQTLLLSGAVSSSMVQAPRAMSERERWQSDASEAFELLQKRYPTTRPPPPIFRVNMSVSQVSRDPEPLVSVVIVPPRRKDVKL